MPGKSWDARTAHLDNPGQLTAFNNIQGRYLNNYADGNICSSNVISNTVTGRFMHIEQYGEARTDPANYPLIKNALLANAICNCAAASSAATTERGDDGPGQRPRDPLPLGQPRRSERLLPNRGHLVHHDLRGNLEPVLCRGL
ncbi:MAG: hypothetical protein ACRDH2_12385 [Anaerolineales bacterium]